MTKTFFAPDFNTECRLCGTVPCVTVFRHQNPDTELCGPHFFDDIEMLDWTLWNEPRSEDE